MSGQAMASYERAVNAVETRLRSTEALEAYFQLGKLRRDHGDFGPAERAYREVLELMPVLARRIRRNSPAGLPCLLATMNSEL